MGIQGQSAHLVTFDEVPNVNWTWTDWAGHKVQVTGRGSGKLGAMNEVLVKDFLTSAPPEFLRDYGNYPVMDARASTFMGVKVAIHQHVNVGHVTCEIANQRLVMSNLTWTALYEEYDEMRRNTSFSPTPTPKIDAVVQCMDEAASSVKTRVVDVSKMGRPIVPMRDAIRPRVSLDRLERVVLGLRELATQLASFGPEDREASPEQVTMFASRYGELAEEMRVVRAAVTEAEGNLDVVQMQIVRLMES